MRTAARPGGRGEFPVVVTGLDPVAHAEFWPTVRGSRFGSMDARVKPGHDEEEAEQVFLIPRQRP
jgi:hypothetical protein